MSMDATFLATQADPSGFLAAMSKVFNSAIERLDILNHPPELIDRLSAVSQVQAGVLVVVGLLCVLNGYRWHRWVVVILAFLGGLVLGNMLSDTVGRSSVVAVAVGALFALAATPMLKLSVAVFGGLTGAFIGANAWGAFETGMQEAHWIGAAMGFIVMAMASFVLFKLTIMLFTSIGGAAMILVGTLTLMLQVEAWQPAIESHLQNNNHLIPLLLAVAAVAGFVVQHGRMQSEPAEE